MYSPIGWCARLLMASRLRCERRFSIWVVLTVVGAALSHPAFALPFARNDLYRVDSNSTKNKLDVLDNDFTTARRRDDDDKHDRDDDDEDDDDRGLIIVGLGPTSARGAVEIDKKGERLRYTPTKGFVGTETFTYTVRDRDGTATAMVTAIVVGDEPTPPDDEPDEPTPPDDRPGQPAAPGDEPPPRDKEPPVAVSVDLATAVSVVPVPVLVNEPATWTVTVRNDSDRAVENVMLDGRFSSRTPFRFEPPANGTCTLTPSTDGTDLSCMLGPLAGRDAISVEFVGKGSQRGDVLAMLTAVAQASAETAPRDSTRTTLSVTESVSEGPAVRVGGFDARALAAGDFNADGFADLAVATGAADSVLILLNVPHPSNAAKRTLDPLPARVGEPALDSDIAAADIDGDGDLDLVTAAGAGYTNRLFLNDGSGAFESIGLQGSSIDSHSVSIADVDGDGLLDLAFANARSDVYLAERAGGYRAPISIGGAESRHVLLADVSGDGLPEVILSNADGDARIYSYSARAFELALTLPTGPATHAAYTDFNQDGAIDLIFAREVGRDAVDAPANLVFLNTLTKPSSLILAESLGAAPTIAVVTEDTNLVGNPDVIALNSTGAHQIFENAGGADAFVLHPQQISSERARAAIVVDLSGDDRVDLAIAGDGGVSVYLNDGNGAFGLGDTEAPKITLIGDASVTLDVGQPYTDPGATAADNVDGILTDRIVVDNSVDTTLIGDYIVSYNVHDRAGNFANTATRVVRVGTPEPNGGGGGGSLGASTLLALLLVHFLRLADRKRRARARALAGDSGACA